MNRYQKYKPIYDEFIKLYPLSTENLRGEIWKVIPNYEDYHVSNFGRVKSFKRKQPYIMKPSLRCGYLYIVLYKDNKPKPFRINRLVAALFIPNPENKPQVNHIDGNKLNNFVGNLEWVTSAENTQHAHDTGLAKSGEDVYNAKLTDAQVVEIRENPLDLNIYQLAEKYGVLAKTISEIQLGKSYKKAGGVIRGKRKNGVKYKLPENVRKEICERYLAGGISQAKLAAEYGVSRTVVRKAIKVGLSRPYDV